MAHGYGCICTACIVNDMKQADALAWREYDSAAEWCARRFYGSLRSIDGKPLPDGLSTRAKELIDHDPEAFHAHIRATAYAEAMRKPGAHYVMCDKCESSFRVSAGDEAVPAHSCWADQR